MKYSLLILLLIFSHSLFGQKPSSPAYYGPNTVLEPMGVSTLKLLQPPPQYTYMATAKLNYFCMWYTMTTGLEMYMDGVGDSQAFASQHWVDSLFNTAATGVTLSQLNDSLSYYFPKRDSNLHGYPITLDYFNAHNTGGSGTVTTINTYGYLVGAPASYTTTVNLCPDTLHLVTRTYGAANYYPLSGNPSGFLTTIAGINAGGDLTGTYPNPTLAIIASAGTTGSNLLIPVITIDSKGRTTGITTTAANFTTFNWQGVSTYTIATSDEWQWVGSTYSTTCTYTIPVNSVTAIPVNTVVQFINVGAGKMTLAGAAGVTLNQQNTYLSLTQGSSGYAVKTATNVWWLFGAWSN